MTLAQTHLDGRADAPAAPGSADDRPGERRSGRPRLTRWGPPVLLLGTAVLYLWGLGASGWANTYYSAAAQAGSVSWEALFFGSTDAANAITVDKPPVALWLMGLSARIFGVNSWAILVPQGLAGVASVWLLYAAVKRWSGAGAGLLAGTALALTPVATLIFRFNNPDALLVLLLVAGAYCVVRATENGAPRWLVLAGVAVGFGFLTKLMQAFLVLPGFALTYLIAAPVSVSRRLLHLLAAAGAVLASAGWYVALVELWPASGRPYIGGSQGNSLLELTLGYNGFGRLTGDEVGSLGGPPGGYGSGPLRLLDGQMGGQIAWLLPAALLVLGSGLWFTRRAPRTDRTRAALVLWGGWLLVTGLVFTFMNGIIHPYYMVALAPAIAALLGAGGIPLWRRRDDPVTAGILGGGIALTALCGYFLLAREGDWPWLAPAVLFTGLAAGALLVIRLRARWVAVLALTGLLLGPASYAVATASVPHSGALPSAGPGGGRGGGPPGGRPPGGGQTARPVGNGGMLLAAEPTPALVSTVNQDSGAYTWVAATVGANNAAGYQLATGEPVLALGGFNGTDPAPTLRQFQQYVHNGQIHYFIGEPMELRANSGSDAANRIATWAAENFRPATVDGVTIYELRS